MPLMPVAIVEDGDDSVPYVLIQDQRAANTPGGSSTAGSFEVRTLQTEVIDTGANCTLSSNQFTLVAGTYRCSAWGVLVNGGQAKNIIWNATDSVAVLIGASEYTGVDGGASGLVVGTFTIGAGKALELRSRVTSSKATDGYGVQANFGVIEIYASIELWKIA